MIAFSTLKWLYAVGAVLTISGCFLPWYVVGDLVDITMYGIWLSGQGFPLKDGGGFLVLCLSTTAVVLAFCSFRFDRKLQLAILVCTSLQLLLVAYDSVTLVVWNYWGPDPKLGLIMMWCGSLLMLYSAIVWYVRSQGR